ncbi:MAG: cytochrome c-type biogenesis protein CcmH [Solirubrobacteraceae bacterium]
MRPKANPSAPPALVLILAALLLTVLAPRAFALGAGGARTTLPAVESEVMCVTCKIPLTVAQSPEATRERVFIQRLIDQGRTEAQIKRALVHEYGPAVLSLPSSRGFGLAVYLVPPLVLLALLALLALLLPRWRRRARAAPACAEGHSPTLTPADVARVDADMARFD